jgi:hypothetical protein
MPKDVNAVMGEYYVGIGLAPRLEIDGMLEAPCLFEDVSFYIDNVANGVRENLETYFLAATPSTLIVLASPGRLSR